MIIIGGSSSTDLAQEIAENLQCDFIKADTQKFPDGECYARVNAPALDDDVVIVQNTYPDENLIEMLLIEDAIRGLGAKSVTLVIPYFGYARQDKIFKPGEPESSKVVSKCLAMGCDRVITIDIHKEDTLKHFGLPYKDLKAAEAIAEYFRDKNINIVFAPDIGAKDRAKNVGERLGVPYDYLEKTRISGTDVRIKPVNSDCTGKNILIVDDMISTGGTIVAATRQLKEAGAKSVMAACTHGVFVNDTLDRLEGSSLDAVLSANTIVSKVSKISVAKIISRSLKEW